MGQMNLIPDQRIGLGENLQETTGTFVKVFPVNFPLNHPSESTVGEMFVSTCSRICQLSVDLLLAGSPNVAIVEGFTQLYPIDILFSWLKFVFETIAFRGPWGPNNLSSSLAYIVEFVLYEVRSTFFLWFISSCLVSGVFAV